MNPDKQQRALLAFFEAGKCANCGEREAAHGSDGMSALFACEKFIGREEGYA